jgi:hypothetical protein
MGQPLKDLESDLVWQLISSTRAVGENRGGFAPRSFFSQGAGHRSESLTKTASRTVE